MWIKSFVNILSGHIIEISFMTFVYLYLQLHVQVCIRRYVSFNQTKQILQMEFRTKNMYLQCSRFS